MACPENLYQGFRWYRDSDVVVRTGSIADIPVGVAAPENRLPIHQKLKRCLLADDGTINYFISKIDPTQKEGGGVAHYDGSDGQVMRYTPLIYWRMINTVDYRQEDFSLYPLPGFVPYPAFYSAGDLYKNIYYAVFEGSMWDESESRIVPAADITTNMSIDAGDKLCSISGVFPKTNQSRPDFRQLAANRGEGWIPGNYNFRSLEQALHFLKYGGLNSQANIGMGRTELSGGDWVADSYIGRTGMSVNDVADNSVSNGGTAGFTTDYSVMNLIENFWGNVWKFMDFITVDGRWQGDFAPFPVYICDNIADMGDEDPSAMSHLCDMPYIGANTGYISDVMDVVGYIPKTANGSSSTKFADYLWQYNESSRDYFRSVRVGATSNSLSSAGVSALRVYASAFDAWTVIGGRFCKLGEKIL
ncbi:MAG: hypothetical protein ACOC2E_00135 [Bacteroidota bacterium]